MSSTKFYPTIWQTIPFSLDVLDIWKNRFKKKDKKSKR